MPLWLSLLVTTTFTAPAACAGVVAVIDVLLHYRHARRCRTPKLHRGSRHKTRTRNGHRRFTLLLPDPGATDVGFGGGLLVV